MSHQVCGCVGGRVRPLLVLVVECLDIYFGENINSGSRAVETTPGRTQNHACLE